MFVRATLGGFGDLEEEEVAAAFVRMSGAKIGIEPLGGGSWVPPRWHGLDVPNLETKGERCGSGSREWGRYMSVFCFRIGNRKVFSLVV